MKKGRLPSLFLLSTAPVGGIWFPPRARDQANRARKWYWDGVRINWTPEEPEGGGKKLDFVHRLHVQIEDYRRNGDASFLKLSGTSKTGITWSLPAVGSCPQVDETCGSCYALDGFYRTNIAAQVGRVMRLEYLRKLIAAHKIGEWVEWIVGRIEQLRPVEAILRSVPLDESLSEAVPAYDSSVAYLRWHDSGDLFHIEYARAILEVCRRTPSVLHWLPTRMGELLASLARLGERFPPNLAVQVSCFRGGVLEKAQHQAIAEIRRIQPNARVGVTYALAGIKSRILHPAEAKTAFGDGAYLCPATVATESEKRVCTNCRQCWARADLESPIVYAMHLGN